MCILCTNLYENDVWKYYVLVMNMDDNGYPWVRFCEAFYFHSLIYNNNNNIIIIIIIIILYYIIL
jgi:hypothetical protein